MGGTAIAANLPCGAWREHTRKFSPQWFLAVHATIPFVAMLRKAVLMPKWAILLTVAGASESLLRGGWLVLVHAAYDFIRPQGKLLTAPSCCSDHTPLPPLLSPPLLLQSLARVWELAWSASACCSSVRAGRQVAVLADWRMGWRPAAGGACNLRGPPSPGRWPLWLCSRQAASAPARSVCSAHRIYGQSSRLALLLQASCSPLCLHSFVVEYIAM
jgi:hypothetical protein